jgi:cytochrome c oxidase subunit 4
VFAVLLIVLATSAVLSRYLHGAVGTLVALALAAVKMTLIFWFFMRLRCQTGTVRLFAAAGFLWLLIAGVLTCADYLTRG